MLQEVFKAIAAYAEKAKDDASKIDLVSVPNSPDGVYVNQGGKRDWVEFDQETTVRHETLDSLVGIVSHFAGGRMPVRVYVTLSSVVVLVGPDPKPDPKEDRVDFEAHVLAVEKTPAFEELLLIVDKKKTQKELLRSLRGKLRDVVAAETRNSLEKIRWSTKVEDESTAGRDSDGLGKKIERAAAGVGEIPEDFDVRFPAFVDPALEEIDASLRLLISFDHDEQKIELQSVGNDLAVELRTLPIEIARVITEKLGTLHADGSVPVHLADAPELTYGLASSLARAKVLLAKK